MEELAQISPYVKNPLIRVMQQISSEYGNKLSKQDRLDLMNICSLAYYETIPILDANTNLEYLAHKTITHGTTKLTLADTSNITIEQNGPEIVNTIPLLKKVTLHPSTLLGVYKNK